MAKIFSSQTKLNINKYKYGVQVTTEYNQALDLDNNNVNTLWQYTVKKDNGKMSMSRYLRQPKGGKHPKALEKNHNDIDHHTAREVLCSGVLWLYNLSINMNIR